MARVLSRSGVSSKVSVVIPTLDRLALLAEALESLRQQTHGDWEAIVVDDGSRDGTPEQVHAWAAADSRIQLLRRDTGLPGGNTCRNLGLAASTGDFVVFLDDDDLLSPHCLEARVTTMHAHPELDFAAFPFRSFHRHPGDLAHTGDVRPGQDDIERILRFDMPWLTTGPIWRRRALPDPHPWDEQLVCWQDWDLSLRALIRGARYHCFPFHPHWFHRIASPGRRTISGQGKWPMRLRSQERALITAHRLLEERGALSPLRRGLLAWQMLRTAELWHDIRQPREGHALWLRCLHSGLVGSVAHLEGEALLRTLRFRPARGVIRRLLRLQWRAWVPGGPGA